MRYLQGPMLWMHHYSQHRNPLQYIHYSASSQSRSLSLLGLGMIPSVCSASFAPFTSHSLIMSTALKLRLNNRCDRDHHTCYINVQMHKCELDEAITDVPLALTSFLV